jgi:predicted phage terminase large subunit-like protein
VLTGQDHARLHAEIVAAESALGRRSFRSFVRLAWPMIQPRALIGSWHVDALCEHLAAVSSGEVTNLVICVPPGTSKTKITSVLWPAWDWISNPARRFLCASYGQDLSDDAAKLHRDLVADPWFRARWDITIKDIAQVRNFKNSAMGDRVSTSVGGRATGIHADIHIGDDLAKAQDAQGRNYVDPQAIHRANAFWFETMMTRRADATNLRRVMIGQRLHHEDTPGLCVEAGYTALVLPMEYDPARPAKTHVYWRAPDPSDPSGARKLPRARFEDPRTNKGDLLVPERFPRDIVDADKKVLGAIAYEAQMQQNPTPASGAVIPVEKVKKWAKLPDVVPIIVVDCAFKDKRSSDPVGIQVWGAQGPNLYMFPWRYNDRTGIAGTIEHILRARAAHPRAAVYVEDKANGPAVIELLKGEVSGVIAWSPGTDSKEARAQVAARLIEAGNVHVPPDDQAPWLGEVLSTWGRFPLVRHDEDVDCLSMAAHILHKPYGRTYADAVANMTRGMLGR